MNGAHSVLKNLAYIHFLSSEKDFACSIIR